MSKHRVALVGLDPDASSSLCLALDPRRYAVDQFGTPVSFLHVLGNLRSAQPRWSPAYDLVVCRLDMPGISGVGLLHQVRVADPTIRVVIACPDLDENLAEDLQAIGVAAVTHAPVDARVFRVLLDHLLSGVAPRPSDKG